MTERQRPADAGADIEAHGEAPVSSRALRVVRLEGFEEAVALSEAERPAYRRRFVTLFADNASARRGGLGRVTRVTNAMGETLALKTLVLPEPDELEDGDGDAGRARALEASFRREYEGHRAVSGLKGVPRLYGFGRVDGEPAIVMEWVEGTTLAEARDELAVDGSGRVAPLVAARVGAELFDLLDRLDDAGSGFVHRDVSPANVMVRTSRVPLARQAEEGAFDLCLVDFGSAAALDAAPATRTATTGTARMATPAYAPPEMLTCDLPHLTELRRSPAVDVFAAASVVFELAGGAPPFDLSGERSPFRAKSDDAPRPLRTAHGEAADLPRVLMGEPEVAVACAKVALELGLDPDDPRLRGALELVDEQLGEMLAPCLSPDQRRRPSAAAVRDGLATFCELYAENVGRALRGEPLLPCAQGSGWLESASPFALRRMVRTAGRAASLGVLAVVVVATGLLVDGALASFSLGSLAWQGRLPGIVVSLALALPALATALSQRGRRGTWRGFAAGTAAVVFGALALLAVTLLCLRMNSPERLRGLHAAILAAAAAEWCPVVLDYAMVVVPALVAEARRRLAAARQAPLPEGAPASAILGDVEGPASLPEGGEGEAPAGDEEDDRG